MAIAEQDAVLRRFGEVASDEYPFKLPEKQTLKGRKLNLKSWTNVQPLLHGGLGLLHRVLRPVSLSLCSGAALFCRESRFFFGWGLLSAFLAWGISQDVFFLHWLTDGRLGGLGGAGATSGVFCKASSRNNRLAERLRRFVDYKPTPYLWSGDLLTLGPFVLYKGSAGGRVNYRRWWVRVANAPAPDGDDGPGRQAGGDDDEAVALDVSFPEGGHRPAKPVFLCLHGLNGGSKDPYVLDLVRRANREGCTAACMIARGLARTPVRGANSFTGARTSDVAAAVDALLYGLGGERRKDGERPKHTRLVLVGFSMGAIVASNYTAKSKGASGLAGTVAFSGTLCSEKMLLDVPSARHSSDVWQRPLAWALKGTIVKPNQAHLESRGITVDMIDRIKTVVDIDTVCVCKYHGYPVVQDYYADMSAGGRGDGAGLKRLQGARVPLLAVNAIDDPISVYETAFASGVVETDNVLLLATKHGGHIGWPLGMSPTKNRWNYMVDIAMEFSSALMEE